MAFWKRWPHEFFKIVKQILAFDYVTSVLETKLFQQAQVNLMLSRFSVLGFAILGTLIGLSGCDQLSSTVKLSGNRDQVEKPVDREVLPLANDLTEAKGLDATAVSKDDSLAVRFELPVAMLTSNLPSLESGVIETLKAQEPLLALIASSRLQRLAKSKS